MSITRAFARSLIGPVFLTRGAEGFLHPDGTGLGAAAVARWLDAASIRVAPDRVARLLGGAQVTGAALLILGRMPRLAATVLSLSLLPDLIGERRRPQALSMARKPGTERAKELAILGGLLFAATDRNGAPSLRWRATQAGRKASTALESVGSSVAERLSHAPLIGSS